MTQSARSVLIDPTDDDFIFAGTEAGLFRSRDGSATWEQLASVPSKPVTSLATDPQGSVLFASVNDVGVFKGVFSPPTPPSVPDLTWPSLIGLAVALTLLAHRRLGRRTPLEG